MLLTCTVCWKAVTAEFNAIRKLNGLLRLRSIRQLKWFMFGATRQEVVELFRKNFHTAQIQSLNTEAEDLATTLAGIQTSRKAALSQVEMEYSRVKQRAMLLLHHALGRVDRTRCQKCLQAWWLTASNEIRSEHLEIIVTHANECAKLAAMKQMANVVYRFLRGEQAVFFFELTTSFNAHVAQQRRRKKALLLMNAAVLGITRHQLQQNIAQWKRSLHAHWNQSLQRTDTIYSLRYTSAFNRLRSALITFRRVIIKRWRWNMEAFGRHNMGMRLLKGTFARLLRGQYYSAVNIWRTGKDRARQRLSGTRQMMRSALSWQKQVIVGLMKRWKLRTQEHRLMGYSDVQAELHDRQIRINNKRNLIESALGFLSLLFLICTL